jgi:hypothetical protein
MTKQDLLDAIFLTPKFIARYFLAVGWGGEKTFLDRPLAYKKCGNSKFINFKKLENCYRKLLKKVNIRLTALSVFRFIRIIKTIVISVANINSRDAVSVVASEEISVAGAIRGRVLIRRFVLSSLAIAVAVAVPRRRNATMVRTSADAKGSTC